MPKSNQHAANVRNVFTHDHNDIATYTQQRISRGRGVMVLFLRPDGRVRVMRDDLLQDCSGKGVVGHFGRHHTIEHIQSKLDIYVASNQAYFDR